MDRVRGAARSSPSSSARDRSPDSDPELVSLPLAFAAGAVIAALADTIMPEAYEHGGPAVALSTAAGFVLSFVLSLA